MIDGHDMRVVRANNEIKNAVQRVWSRLADVKSIQTKTLEAWQHVENGVGYSTQLYFNRVDGVKKN